MIHLVTKEISEVLTKGGDLLVFRITGDAGPVFIILNIPVFLAVPHPGEDRHVIGIIDRDGPFSVIPYDVPARPVIALVKRLAVFPANDGSVVILSVSKGEGAVLFPVQVGQKADGIFGVVLVDGGVGIGADDEHEE